MKFSGYYDCGPKLQSTMTEVPSSNLVEGGVLCMDDKVGIFF